MKCSLCRAEYREEKSACATCGARLLREGEALPARMVWKVNHRDVSRAVLEALRDAGIACWHRALRDHWPHALLLRRPEFEVWILKSDAAAAHDVLAQMSKPPEFEDEAPEIVARNVLPCPLCRAENPESYQVCASCGIDLTTWRSQPFEPSEPSDPTEDDPPVLLWKGSEAVALSRIVDRLQTEAMPFSIFPTPEHLAFGLAIPRPRWEIRVYRSDAERAFALIEDVTEPFPLVDNSEDAGATDGEERGSTPSDVTEKRSGRFNPSVATVELWAGEDPGLAQALRLALRENSVDSWTIEDPPGVQHIWVEPKQEERAREIVSAVLHESVGGDSSTA